MKNNLIISAILMLLIPLSYCGKNEDPTPVEFDVNNINIRMDENPENGQSIAFLNSDLKGIIFNIIHQSPDGGVQINQNSGELTVLDKSVFDFELNPKVELTIGIELSGFNDEVEVLIQVNDIKEVSELDEFLVGYFPFNGNATDESHYGNSAVVIKADLDNGVDGSSNSSYHFDSNNDFIYVPDSIIDLKEEYMISYWVRLDSLNMIDGQCQMLTSRHDLNGAEQGGTSLKIISDDNGYFYMVYYKGDNGLIDDYFERSFGDKVEWLDGNWHHVLLSHAGGNYEVYIDGELNTNFEEDMEPDSGIGWAFGGIMDGKYGNQPGETFRGIRGNLDQIRFYNISLDEYVKVIYDSRL